MQQKRYVKCNITKQYAKKYNQTMNKTPPKYSRPSSRGHRKYRVQMTFLVTVSIKLKIQTCFRRH